MQLRLKPAAKNSFPLAGLLIKGSSITWWAQEIQRMQLTLAALTVYPIPGNTANSVWGCLITGTLPAPDLAGKNNYCQLVGNKLFIPTYCTIYPALAGNEINQLFRDVPSIFHPDFGLVTLTEPVNWAHATQEIQVSDVVIDIPGEPIYLPANIHSFLLHPALPEEALEALEKKIVPEQKKFEDKPLNLFEKLKLAIYRKLFKPATKEERSGRKRGYLLKQLDELGKRFTGKESGLADNLLQDYEDLEQRNQQELDKLLELFKKNPEEALKYALPLNDETARGNNGNQAPIGFMQRWFNFSLSGNMNTGGSGVSILSSSQYNSLEEQYRKTAAELVRQREYHKAAFVYMKLLKDYHSAARVLEEGLLYEDAASVYLKYLHNKEKAAECYEKGMMTMQAIELYAALGKHEKAGDLYMGIHKKKEAHYHYRKEIDQYVTQHQYIAATRILKPKMNETAEAQALLLEGWKGNYDALNCLNHYFANIEEVQQLRQDMQQLYHYETTLKNREQFLQALKHIYDRHEGLSDEVRDMAYEIIAEQADHNATIVNELRFFKKNDTMILKDIMKYRNRKQGK